MKAQADSPCTDPVVAVTGRIGGAERSRRRIALYSPGMVGIGHMRRNLLIAQTLAFSRLQPIILMIAETREANVLSMPPGGDCLTLPALRKDANGECRARYLDLSLSTVISLRSRAIAAALEVFQPRRAHRRSPAARRLSRARYGARRFAPPDARAASSAFGMSWKTPRPFDASGPAPVTRKRSTITTMPFGSTGIELFTIPFCEYQFWAAKWPRRCTLPGYLDTRSRPSAASGKIPRLSPPARKPAND